MVNNTILDYVKTKVDLELMDTEDVFKDRLIMEIEAAIGELQQLTKVNDVDITEETTFEQLLESNDSGLLMLCKNYIGICVRLAFDPPSGSILTSLEKTRDTIASRITIQPIERQDG